MITNNTSLKDSNFVFKAVVINRFVYNHTWLYVPIYNVQHLTRRWRYCGKYKYIDYYC